MSSLNPGSPEADTEMSDYCELPSFDLLGNTTSFASTSARGNSDNALQFTPIPVSQPDNTMQVEIDHSQSLKASYASSSRTDFEKNTSLHHTLQQSSPAIVPAQALQSQFFDIVKLNQTFELSVQLQYFHNFVVRCLKIHPFNFRLSSDEEICEEISCWGPEQCYQFALYIEERRESEFQDPSLQAKRQMGITKRQNARQRAEQLGGRAIPDMSNDCEQGEGDDMGVRYGKDVMDADFGGKRMLDFEPDMEGPAKRVAHKWS